jgi:transcription antitermination factor NusG
MIRVAECSVEQAGLPLLHTGERELAVDINSQIRWHALYTRSRHEKIVVRELAKHKIETFLPLRKIKRHWSDRVKVIEEPLFHSYIFTRIPISKKLTVLNTYGAVSFVHFGPNLPAIIPDKDISALKRFSEEDLPMDPFPYLKEGQRVYIRSGAFKGIEGFIVRKDQHCRLVISVDVLQQSVSVEIDAASIELCEG